MKVTILIFGLMALQIFSYSLKAKESSVESTGWGDAGKKSGVAPLKVPVKHGDMLLQGFSKKIS